MTLGKLIGRLATWEDDDEKRIVVVWAQDKDIWNLVEPKKFDIDQLHLDLKQKPLARLIAKLLEHSENSEVQPVFIIYKQKPSGPQDKDIWNVTASRPLQALLFAFCQDPTQGGEPPHEAMYGVQDTDSLTQAEN